MSTRPLSYLDIHILYTTAFSLEVVCQRVPQVVNRRFASNVKGLRMATLLELVHSVPHDFLLDNTDAGDDLLRHPRSSPENDDSRIANSQSCDNHRQVLVERENVGI